jgi:hypothetical protein
VAAPSLRHHGAKPGPAERVVEPYAQRLGFILLCSYCLEMTAPTVASILDSSMNEAFAPTSAIAAVET